MVATHQRHDPTVHNRHSSPGPVGVGDAAGSWEWVAAAQRGDREAFARLYARYAGPVAALVTARTGDRMLAQDLTSETFTRAWRRIDSVRDQGRDVGAWLSTIARNLVADHYKSSRSRLERTTGEFPEHGRFVVSGGQAPSPEGVVIARETTARLARHIAGLPTAEQRECLRLRFWEGRSVSETAAVMGRHPGAVKALQHRALTGLRASLTAEDQTPPGPGPVVDPLDRARRAVAAAQARAGGQHHRAERARAQHLAAGRATDHTTTVDAARAGDPRAAVLGGRGADRDALGWPCDG